MAFRTGTVSIAAMALTVLTGGCSTLFNPYLDSTPLDQASLCDTVNKDSDCTPLGRFKAVKAGVEEMQKQARNSYMERAELNTTSSALAFPLVGILLYRGTTLTTDNGRNALLKGAVAVGAGYETRNALLAGSPESIYILSEARLACVLDEAAKYRLDLPMGNKKKTCDDASTDLLSQADALMQMEEIDNKYEAPRAALVTRVNYAVNQYNTAETTLASAADKMQATARKIVLDTNAQIHTPSISPATATALLKSEMALFPTTQPLPTDKEKGGAMTAKGAPTNIVDEINKLSSQLNGFARSCLRPQPASVSAFDACTTYSPTVPPLPSITTDLLSNQATLNFGDSLTFVATSNPSGTPWASFAGNASVAQKSLGELQQITLSPTQTQVSVTYNKTRVSADTHIVISLNTRVVPGNATTVTVTLNADKAAALPEAVAVTGVKTTFSGLKKNVELMKKLGLPETANEDAVKGNLRSKWIAICGFGNPTEQQLLDTRFLAAVKAGAGKPDPNQPFCSK
jgi:hypothetical protein